MKEMVQFRLEKIMVLRSKPGNGLYLAGVGEPGDRYFVIPVRILEAYDLLAKLQLNHKFQFLFERVLLTAIESSGIWIENIRIESRADQECLGLVDLGFQNSRQTITCRPLVAVTLGLLANSPVLVEQTFIGRIQDAVGQALVSNSMGTERDDFSSHEFTEWLCNVQPRDFG